MSGSSASSDFSTFIGDVYARWTLDCLVEIGYAIAVDFVNRPQLYQSDVIPDNIVRLRMSYGTTPAFPNAAQRQGIMAPIFGRSDGLKPDATNASSSFQMARKKLIDACIAYSERAVDTGIPMLEERVRSALVPLTAQLFGLRGRSLELGGGQIQTITGAMFDILVSPGVTQVFSVTEVQRDWPLHSIDPNGAKLVETAGVTLALSPDYKLSYTRFVLLQRVAQEGARALSVVVTTDPKSESQLQSLITQCYTWGTSLRDFQQAS
jgi:hypothetical protein